MPKIFTSESQRTGEIGEHLVARYLSGKGFKILERNYTKKWGEIDIIARKGKLLHFIEVKSRSGIATAGRYGYRPEDNMHPWKIKRLKRTIQTYLLERKVEEEWQFDLAVVYIDLESNAAKIEILENVIL